jgi:hypothetical protein
MLPELLLYAALSCQQADSIMFRITKNDSLRNETKLELVETIRDSTPECDWYWDAND